jgi:glycine cleavage system H protein
MVPKDLRFSREHEWVRVEGDVATVGIFVELPEVGRKITQFGSIGVVESVKAVSDLFAPVGGEVVEINDVLSASPELLNSDPFGGGWMFRVRLADPGQVGALLDAAAYEKLTAEG